jgi:parallel beta-helix repeat protein
LAVTVTNTNDAGTGSLREAITTVNAEAVANTITFQDLAVGTITPLTALPHLTNPAGTIFSFGGSTEAITLDGASIPNADGLTIGAGVNQVVISGLKLTLSNFDSGLKFLGGSTGSTVSGLTLTNNTNGIELVGGALTGTTIAGNTISLNSQNGVLATGGVTGLTLGGSGAGNTVQYNQTGFFFQQGSFASTVVQGNTISANYGDGILLGSGGGVLTGLTIGGTASAANTISFNQDNGVEVRPGTFTNTVVSGNSIASNGGYGVSLFASGQTLQGLTVGGTTAGAGNTIESNEADGVGIFGGTYTNTAVQGNTIRYNQNGVSLNVRAGGDPFSGLLLGGDNAGSNTAINTITQNSLDGVLVNAGVYSSTFIRGNTISSNGRNGVNFLASFGEKITGLQLGGSTSTLANTITGNAASGLAASKGDYTSTAVLGNTFSTNKFGISLTNAQNLNIGGPATAFKNTVNSNTETGLFATGTLTGTVFQRNSLTGNPLGVSLLDAQGLSLGSATAGDGNTIAGGTTGVRAVGNLSSTVISGNAITGQTTGIQMINATGASSATPFFVGGAATTVGNGAGNYVASTVHGLYAAGTMTNTTIAGNIFSASALGGNAMVLENATGLTVGGSTAGFGNTLTAAQGNGLWAAGHSTGTGFYRNTLTASKNGAVLINATKFLFGVANNAALRNTVQYNQVGVLALGNCAGSGVCFTVWTGNVRKIRNTATGLLVTPKP